MSSTDNEDEDEEPSTGSNWGSKRRRAGKEPELTSAPKEKTSKSTGMSKEGSKSHQAEEPTHTVDDFEEPINQEFDTRFTEDQTVDETTQLLDWFQKPTKPPNPNRDWNKSFPASHGPIQPWVSNVAGKEDPRESFNEQMDTSLDFLAFVLVELEYFHEEVCKATTDKLDWNNPEGQQYPHDLLNRESAHDVYSKNRIIGIKKLTIVEWHNYKHLEWITVRIDDDKFFGCFIANVFKKQCHQKACRRSSIVDQKLPKEAQPHKARYNKDKKNRLMRIDELHKFSDGTLNDVRSALDDTLKRIWMKYPP
ncbi:hypothetical protein Tco_1346939 [Tanacetum coccineum]